MNFKGQLYALPTIPNAFMRGIWSFWLVCVLKNVTCTFQFSFSVDGSLCVEDNCQIIPPRIQDGINTLSLVLFSSE